METRIINNQYALTPLVKKGGMAEVYRAADLYHSGRTVALKLFTAANVDEDMVAESFKRETLALKELKHESIVELLDVGTDRETGRHFIVLEWIEGDLSDWLTTSSLTGWDSFYETIGQDVLRALAFAHNRNVIHRDLKTKNILIDQNGRVKLIDFGIAQLKSAIQSAVTLVDFISPPFTPREIDDGEYSYTRDLYGFGVVVLDCLTTVELRDYPDVYAALGNLNVPPDVFQLIERCVSVNPADRPVHAGILLQELDNIRARCFLERIPKSYCHLRLAATALNTLRTRFRLRLEADLQKAILDDLGAECGIEPYRSPKDEGVPTIPLHDGDYTLFGTSYLYRAMLNGPQEDRLVIVNAWPFDPSYLEKKRETAWPLPYQFKFGNPRTLDEGQRTIRELQLEVGKHQAELQSKRVEDAEERLLQIWKKTLDAKAFIERNREPSLQYTNVSFEGRRVIFHLVDLPDRDLLGQARRVKLTDGNYLRGEVEEIRVDKLHLFAEQRNHDLVPKSGKLEFDTSAANQAIDRQKRALESVRSDEAVRSDLRYLIVQPAQVTVPEISDDLEFFNASLDSAKRTAVQKALGTRDFLVVEGPPGTGKTTFITEVILQYLSRNPDARILLASQTHVALDNALEKISDHIGESKQFSDIKLVRIGRNGDPRIAPAVHHLLVDNQMDSWCEEAITQGREFLSDWATDSKLSRHNVEVAKVLKKLSITNSDIENKEAKLADLRKELSRLDEGLPDTPFDKLLGEGEVEFTLSLRDDIYAVDTDLKAVRKEARQLAEQLRKLEPDVADDLLNSSPAELGSWISDYLPDSPGTRMYLQLLSIQLEWEQRFGRGKDFQTALFASSHVVAGTCIGAVGVKGIAEIDYDLCIVDEASKATPTEALVPLSRSRKWILVGDQRQLSPFQEDALQDQNVLESFQLTRDDLKRTLFDHLVESLPPECRSALTTQHRMVPPIGNLISECFYDGALNSARKVEDNLLGGALKARITWFSTSRLQNRQEYQPGKTSYVNPCEISIILQTLKRIQFFAKIAKRHYSVGVLTAYAGQKRELERQCRSQSWDMLNIECNTVDAFQGREKDVVIYSVTRSNDLGDIGFLREMKRINVALSRGRDYLAIVGDHKFCRSSSGENPLKDVVKYMESHLGDCRIEEVRE
ncbi:MAG: AAA domain-containing protein [Acidobacteriota bacterium]